MTAGAPEGGRERRSEVAERLLKEVRLAEAEERAAKSRLDAETGAAYTERMAETEAAYRLCKERTSVARRKYRRFLQSLAARGRRGRR